MPRDRRWAGGNHSCPTLTFRQLYDLMNRVGGDLVHSFGQPVNDFAAPGAIGMDVILPFHIAAGQDIACEIPGMRMGVSFVAAREMVKNRMKGFFPMPRMREQKLLKLPAQSLVFHSHNSCKIQRHVVA